MKDIWSGSAHLLTYHWTNVGGYDDGGLVEEGTHTNWRLSLTSLMTPAILPPIQYNCFFSLFRSAKNLSLIKKFDWRQKIQHLQKLQIIQAECAYLYFYLQMLVFYPGLKYLIGQLREVI